MAIHLGGGAVSKLMLGASAVQRAYLGASAVYDNASGPTLADVLAIPEVDGVFVPEPAYTYTDAGTTPVSADGDLVQELHCAAGSGVVLALAGSGLTWHTDGSRQWLDGNGTGMLAGSAKETWAPGFFMAVGARNTTTNFARIFTVGSPTEGDKQHYLASNPSEPNIGYLGLDGNGASWSSPGAGAIGAGDDVVILAEIAGGSATATVNGATQSPNSHVYGGAASDEISLLGRNDQTGRTPDAGRVYGAVVASGIPSAADRDTIQQWLASRAGVSL